MTVVATMKSGEQRRLPYETPDDVVRAANAGSLTGSADTMEHAWVKDENDALIRYSDIVSLDHERDRPF